MKSIHVVVSNHKDKVPVLVPPIQVREYTMDSIEDAVCEKYNYAAWKLHVKTRKREVVKLRQFCMYLMEKNKCGSLNAIGEHFGGFDHTTVLHSKQVIIEIMEVDKDLRDEFEELERFVTQKHISEMSVNKVLTPEERRAICTKAVEDATTILVNAMNYVQYKKPDLWANVTGPDGKLYKITIERHGE